MDRTELWVRRRVTADITRNRAELHGTICCREYSWHASQIMPPYVTEKSLSQKTAIWLDQVASYNKAELRLKTGRAALLLIDMQHFFLAEDSPMYTCGGSAILPNLVRLVGQFRKANRPVIFTRHVHHPSRFDAGNMGWWWQPMCKEGTPESEIVPALSPLPEEKVVCKHRYSAFYNTDLELILRCQGIEDVVIGGVMTNLCCETTARDAFMRDYRVFFLADGTGSLTEELHQASLLSLALGFATITTCDQMIATLQERRKPSP